MIIYIDENMSPFLARGFNLFHTPLNQKLEKDINVLSIREEFGRGAKDEDWIPTAGKQSASVITQDYNIRRTKHQHTLCQKYSLGIFYLKPPSKKGFTYWDMVRLPVKHWE